MRLERPKTVDEKQDYKDLNEKTAETIFMDVCNKKAFEFVVAHKPFCRKCALEEFKMQKQSLHNEMKLRYQRNFTECEPPFIELVNKFDFAKYGKPDYFELIGVDRTRLPRKSGGETWNELSVDKNFVCKPYNHGCTVSIAQSEMNNDELTEEHKRINDRKKMLQSLEGAENLPEAGTGIKHKDLPTTKTVMPQPNPLGN